jgi:uncharacterized protein
LAAAQLFDGAGAVFDVTGLGILGIVALGGLSFSLGWMAIERLHRERRNRHVLEPDPVR